MEFRSNQVNVEGTRASPWKENIPMYIFGFVFLSYLSILFGAAYTDGCGLTQWLNQFNRLVLVEHHFIVGFTSATPKVLLFVWCVYFLVVIYSATRYTHPFAGKEYGDAKWGNPIEFSKECGNHDPSNFVQVNFGENKAPDKPVMVNTHNYWMAEGTYVSIDNKRTSNLNILLVGPPGTGKSFRFARPILSQLCGSFLVTDPKGELSDETGQFFEDNGYEPLILNVESEETMANSIHFNPFRYLHSESDLMSLSQILFKSTSDPNADGGGNDAFFEQSAETLMTDIFYLMFYTYDRKDQDWVHFVELLESTLVKSDPKTGGIDNSDENGILQRFEKANDKWRKGEIDGIKHTEDLKGIVDVRKFYNGAQETTSSIVASLDTHCRYMKLDCVKELLSEDDINIIENFGYCKKTKRCPTGKRILYLVTSENKRYFDWIPSMIYSIFFEQLYHLTGTDPSLNKTLPEHLTFLMDEANNVTLPDGFVDLTSTMRSRGMSVILIFQNLKQIKNKFPKNDMDKNLIGNMSFVDILGAPDNDSCKDLSEMFGKTTIRKQTTGDSSGGQGSHSKNEDVMEMPLLSPQQISGMDKDGPCAIYIKGADPLWVKKCQFQNSPLLPLLTRKNPYKMRKREKIVSQSFDPDKSYLDQLPKVYIGKAAKDLLDECRSQNIRVCKFTDEDLDAVSVLEYGNYKLPDGDASTETYWKSIEKNSSKVMKSISDNYVRLSDYTNDQVLLVQFLLNKGFNKSQIAALDGLIKYGVSQDELLSYFNCTMAAYEIRKFADRLLEIKKKTSSSAASA
jgi:type IV secretion system protein VirD4